MGFIIFNLKIEICTYFGSKIHVGQKSSRNMGKKNKAGQAGGSSLGRSLIKDRFANNRGRKMVSGNTMVSEICLQSERFALAIFLTLNLNAKTN